MIFTNKSVILHCIQENRMYFGFFSNSLIVMYAAQKWMWKMWTFAQVLTEKRKWFAVKETFEEPVKMQKSSVASPVHPDDALQLNVELNEL